MTFPAMDGVPATNLYEEHCFVIQVTFGSSSAVTYIGRDCSMAKTTTTTFTFTLPQVYGRITRFEQGWKKATGADPLSLQITTDNVATDGTIVFTTVSTNSAGTATAPASGDVVWLSVYVTQNELNDRFTG